MKTPPYGIVSDVIDTQVEVDGWPVITIEYMPVWPGYADHYIVQNTETGEYWGAHAYYSKDDPEYDLMQELTWYPVDRIMRPTYVRKTNEPG